MKSVLGYDGTRVKFGYCRPLESFRLRESEFLVEYDASLAGLGIVLYKVKKMRRLYGRFS